LYSLAAVEPWESMPYGSTFKFELRVNNRCLERSSKTSDDSYCFKVRMRYNGDFMNFRLQTLFHAHDIDTPSGNDELIQKRHEEEDEVVYDLLWAEFIDMYERAIKVNGTLSDICDKPFDPNKTLSH